MRYLQTPRIEPIEAERRALHALLFEHPRGLTLADLAIELAVTEERAEELLRTQEVKQLIRSEVDEDAGVLRYVTLRASAPSTDASTAIHHLHAARFAHLDATRRRLRVVLGAMAVGVAVAAVSFLIVHAVRWLSATGSSPPSLPLADERAFAVAAAERRRAWVDEAEDLHVRTERLDDDACTSDCLAHWSSEEPCYVSHRLMTRAMFDDERARMALRAAQLRRLLEESR